MASFAALARRKAATPCCWQRQLSIIPEHILILLYERLVSHDGVKPVKKLQNIPREFMGVLFSLGYIFSVHIHSALCAKMDLFGRNFTYLVLTDE